MKRDIKFGIAGIASAVAALVVLKIGSIYDLLVFRPSYHGGWWEAMWTGSIFDFEGAMAFAKSPAGMLTYGLTTVLVLISIACFYTSYRLIVRSGKGAAGDAF